MEEPFKKCIFYLNNFECILLFQKLENMVKKKKNKKIKKKVVFMTQVGNLKSASVCQDF